MESYLMDFFTSKDDIKDKSLQKTVIKSAEQMFVDIAKHTSAKGAAAYYFRFDPSISTGTSGLFHTKLSGSDTFHVVEPTDMLGVALKFTLYGSVVPPGTPSLLRKFV